MRVDTDSDILDMIQRPATREAGFRALLSAHQEQVYWQVRRMVHDHSTADDVVQEVFIKVYRHIGKFAKKSSLATWIYRIAHNEALSYLRTHKRHPLEDISDHHERMELMCEDPYFDADGALATLHVAIQGLPVRQKQVFCMRYFDEMPYAQIAEVLELSVGSLKASYHHASKKIESSLRESIT